MENNHNPVMTSSKKFLPVIDTLLQGGDVLYEARRLSVGKGGHRAVEPTGQHQWHLCSLSGELENTTASALDITSHLHRQ